MEQTRQNIIAGRLANQLLMAMGTRTRVAGEQVFYHGGLPSGSDKSVIDPFKEAKKQNKPGRHYGGFYMTKDIDYAKNYVRHNGGGLFKITISGGRSFDMSTGIERIKVDDLKELSKKYDLLYGKEIMGHEVYVLLNPSIIKDFEEVKDEKDNSSNNQ